MSFKLGDFDTREISGLTAILRSMPSLPVETTLTAYPSGDGGNYSGTRMSSLRWEFSLKLTGRTPEEVLALADEISYKLNPQIHGLQDFIPENLMPWVWQGVVSGGVSWERDDVLWLAGYSVLNGSLEIVTPDPYGKCVMPVKVRTSPGGVELEDIGNTFYRPYIVIQGASPDTSDIRIEAPDGVCRIFTLLTSAEELVLDYENLNFFIRSKSTKKFLRNVADHFEEFHRFTLVGDSAISITANTAKITRIEVTVTSRRI